MAALALPELLKKHVIAFEGNIAAGKSTLGELLKKLFPDGVEYAAEDVNREFLGLFYGDPAAYGFAFQVRMLMVRRNQLDRAKMHNAYPAPSQLFYWDRSMLGDHMFALWNHLTGSIKPAEMRAYERDAGGSLACMREMAHLSEVHLFVLLNSEPAACKRRAESARCNKEESGIPLDYYEGIDDVHFYSFLQLIEQKLPSRVLILNWGEYDSAEQVLPRLEEALKIGAAQPTIARLPHKPVAAALAHSGVKLYRTEKDVLDAYALVGSLERASTVYLPENIMELSPESKRVTNTAGFPIKFYQNAYKRVLLTHLSHNSRLVLYKA